MSDERFLAVRRSGEIGRFVAGRDGSWDHAQWLQFRERIRTLYGDVDGDRLGLLLEEEKRSQQQAKHILDNLKRKLNDGKRAKVTFILVGRTGVGKSSTVNSLLGKTVARVSDDVPTTMRVELYPAQFNGIQFVVADTPGLCDDLPEAGKDDEYLALMRSRVPQFDCLWFVSRLDDVRVSADEKRGIMLVSQAFGHKVWEHAVLVFTFASKVEASEYTRKLLRRSELLRDEVAKYAGEAIGRGLPAVAVDNKDETTPDGTRWMGELYTRVFVRMSERSIAPFLIGTVNSIHPQTVQRGPSEPSGAGISSSGGNLASTSGPSAAAKSEAPRIELNVAQKREILKTINKEIDARVIPGLAVAGASIGLVFGPAGAAIGGGVGATIGLVAWLWSD
jgi:GTP-binding protein EngB required for normal cell division